MNKTLGIMLIVCFLISVTVAVVSAGNAKLVYDKNGYDQYGYNKQGYDKAGYDKNGYNKNGYDKNGYNRQGYNKEGQKKNTGSNNLKCLTISNGILSPSFSSNIMEYTDQVSNEISSITITPTTENSKAKIAVNGIAVSSGHASHKINLKVGINTIKIVITAKSGVTKTYNVKVVRSDDFGTHNTNKEQSNGNYNTRKYSATDI